MPRISIGMPVYNGERFLEETLNALLAQTFKDVEVIISDNASTDRTQAICHAYMSKDARIRYVRNETNLGAAKNFNRVFELSSSEYFKWAAADDLCAPDYLAKCVAVLDTHPEVILCYPKTTIIDAHGNTLMLYEDGLDLRQPRVRDRYWQANDRRGECNAVLGVIRSSILRKTSLIGNYIASDRVLLTELALYGQFYELPEHLFFRRQHPQASSSNKSIESLQEFFDPKTKGKICLYNWRHVFQHLLTIKRAPLQPVEKAQLVWIILYRAIAGRRLLMRELRRALRQVVSN
jgi:glycosyltransferase involved in cell wall biosynthesis